MTQAWQAMGVRMALQTPGQPLPLTVKAPSNSLIKAPPQMPQRDPPRPGELSHCRFGVEVRERPQTDIKACALGQGTAGLASVWGRARLG